MEGWEAQGAGQLPQVSRAASESQAEVTRDGEKTQVAWAGIFEGEEQAGGEGESRRDKSRLAEVCATDWSDGNVPHLYEMGITWV